MDFTQSQQDMNASYVGGATGVLASGLIWLCAAIIAMTVTEKASMAALFVGGMFIFPLSIVFSKLLSASGKHSSQNLLRHLALETLPILFVGLLIAFYVAQIKVELFFPIMLMVIGARYFAFQTMYSLKAYWLLGALLVIAGVISASLSLPFVFGAFAGGIIEVVFAIILFKQSKAT
ncbi:hypothetical protein ISG33_02670 [Glaciecola sp. MH2013]|uniref:DUF7010 family protein n=1 Tax=Glaciecola sp. MH2013 TaxID=2785524 RepID=UPI0018A0BE53|nr:hypothetical protein [Glaciecola sp. MH2013]MBF7072306.1 hypothetical protein [Glaciecola sp. MH2013]